MQDLISRQSAIDALIEGFRRSPTVAIRAKDMIEQLPSVQPTLYGYNVEHLICRMVKGEQMSRLIDADALIAEMHNVILEDGEDRKTFYEVIERQPTIKLEV